MAVELSSRCTVFDQAVGMLMHGGDNETGVWRYEAPCVVFVQQENCKVYVNTHQMQHMKCSSVRVDGDWGLQEYVLDPSSSACQSARPGCGWRCKH